MANHCHYLQQIPEATTMVEASNSCGDSRDAGLNALAAALDSAHLIAFVPSLFVDWVTAVQSGSECAAIRKLIDQFLWPMALDVISHPIMNRVRQGPRSPVLPYRILITPLCETEHSRGFVAALRHHEQKPFDAANLAALKAAVPDLHERLSARVDEVTGLLLWPEFQAEAASRSLHTERACVVYANLDQMHVVNEISGFAVGDQLIRAAGGLLRDELISTRSIATHLSGDRFVAVLFDHTLNQARHWAEQVRQQIERSEQCATHGVTASLGVAELHPGGSLHHALAAAETTCCIAKDRGRNRVELYVSGDDTVVRRHNAIGESREILEALDGDRLILYAQPIVTLADVPCISHYEVLLRIQAQDGDTKSISDLLPAADRYQLFERIDRWVLSKLLPLVAQSGDTLHRQGVCFAVNVTGQSVSEPSFADFVRGEIRHRGIRAGLVEFELTETAAVRNVTATQRFIARMAEVGSRVSLDDFGTGLSSLVHLKELDVHRIKIDGRFVRDVLSNERSRALIRALVQIADAIGLQTVAEFVESEAIATRVRELGVHCAQGYHYGRAVPLADVLRRLTATAGETVSPEATPASAATVHAA
jgi:diguanylate cyclase (GGDEF)-like protein